MQEFSALTQNNESHYIAALRKNYDERVQQLHLMVRECVLRMENDEILATLKNDVALEEYRVQRI